MSYESFEDEKMVKIVDFWFQRNAKSEKLYVDLFVWIEKTDWECIEYSI